MTATPIWLLLTCGVGADRPNFVVMMTDDQRADKFSHTGDPLLKTPNLDKLRAGGMSFRRMYVTNALCAPSRATLLTGLYSHAHGVTDNKDRRLNPSTPILSDLLREAGYEAAFCGKSHIGGALRDRKWDYYFGFKGQGNYLKPVVAEGTNGQDLLHQGYMDDVVTDKAINWLTNRNKEKPFVLFLFFKAPHRSWQRAPRHAHLYEGMTVPKPPTWDDPGVGKPKTFLEADNKIGSFPDAKDLDVMVKDYNATITAVDENVGRVLATIDELKLADTTNVMFTSDNGFFLGEWQRFDKRFMHEVSARVPMIVRGPGIAANSTCNKIALNVDIAPTILDMAGVKPRVKMHGCSFAPLLKGETPADWRKDWLYEYYEFPGPHSVKPNRGVADERYKFIHYYTDPVEYELYDLETDPQELKNLADDPKFAGVRKRLAQRLDELRKETDDRFGDKNPADMIGNPKAVGQGRGLPQGKGKGPGKSKGAGRGKGKGQ
jgi:arylsulfatase A-like enzyme